MASSSPFTGVQWGAGGGTTRVTWSFAALPGELATFSASIGDAAYQGAIRNAFAVWERLANIDFVEAADSLSNGIRLGWATIDGAGSILAQANWRYSGRQIFEADIAFDTAESWRPTGGSGAPTFFATAIHEIGHAIGLAHVDDKKSIMYPYQTSVAAPSAADIDSVRAIYGAPVTAPAAPVTSANDVFRFYNGETGVHFYTNSAAERDMVKSELPQYSYEGAAFKAAPGDGGDATIHRFFNASTGAHFYTASEAERDMVQATLPQFRYEGAAFKAFADAGANGEHHAVFRFLRTDTGTHFYTTSETEKASVESALPHYRYEGVAYYADWA